ncbi:19986_t:CDS:2, partial [Gigaspora margarita]
MIRKNTITLATLNVQGLNSEQKCRDILDNLSQLLNNYTFDIILLQETNVRKQNIDYIKENLWKYESEWTSKTAVLAGNMYISFKNFEEIEYGCKTVNIVGKSSFSFHKKMINNQATRANSQDYIFVDNDNAQFCREMETHLNIFDQPLIACTLELSTWRLNEQLLEVPSIREEIQQKLTSLNNVTVPKWDNIKMQIQFTFRAHPAHKSKSKKSNKKSNNSILNRLLSDLDIDLDYLNPEIKEELTKEGWIKGKEKSTLKIRDPSSPSENPADILMYIKNHYKILFEKKTNDSDIANTITDNLPQLPEGNYPELKESQTNRILGFYVDKKGQNEKGLWQKKIEVIKEAMRKVDKINQSTNKNKLSPKSRVQLVRLFLSKSWHASYLQPATHQEILKLSDII